MTWTFLTYLRLDMNAVWLKTWSKLAFMDFGLDLEHSYRLKTWFKLPLADLKFEGLDTRLDLDLSQRPYNNLGLKEKKVIFCKWYVQVPTDKHDRWKSQTWNDNVIETKENHHLRWGELTSAHLFFITFLWLPALNTIAFAKYSQIAAACSFFFFFSALKVIRIVIAAPQGKEALLQVKLHSSDFSDQKLMLKNMLEKYAHKLC